MRIFEFIPEGTSDCNVKAWIHDQNGSKEIKQRIHPAVIVCPGGGYSMVSDREAEPVARAYFAAGYNTYILSYSVGKEGAIRMLESFGSLPYGNVAPAGVIIRPASFALATMRFAQPSNALKEMK